jgi:hypothetical protein
VPALQPYINFEPIWEQFEALLPERRTNHPLGCHRGRIPDRVVFGKLVEMLVFGCAYWRISDESCSESTLRRRRDEWIDLGLMETLREISLEAYDRLISLELADLAVDGCITKAPCGGEKAGRSPVDRGKGGIKRSMVVDARGIPLGSVIAPATDTTRRCWTQPSTPWRHSENCRIERACVSAAPTTRSPDSVTTHRTLAARCLAGEISEKGKPAPLKAGKRWVVEQRTNSWHNAHKKLVWCTERCGRVIDFWVAFSDVVIIVRRLIREGWSLYRWEGRPSQRP